MSRYIYVTYSLWYIIGLFARKVDITYSVNPMFVSNRPALANIILLSNGSSLCCRNGWNLYISKEQTNVCIAKLRFATYFGLTYVTPKKAAAYDK